MSSPDPQSPYYDFHVKNPPQLPPTFKDSYGADQPTSWDQHARDFVARYSQNGTDFDVALENSNTAQWPYHLGSTIQGPEVSPLIRKWGLQILEAAGFVNHEPEVGEVYTDPIGRLAKTRNPLDEPEKQIHPVLRREMFTSITNEDYELMQPALLLASAILDDPTTLHFFYAVSHLAQHSWITHPKLGKCRVVTVPATLTKAQQTAAIKKIMDMRSWTSWEINDHEYFKDNIALAVTDTRSPPYHTSSSVDTVYKTNITLSPQWIATLKGFDEDIYSNGVEYNKTVQNILDQAGVPANRRPNKFHLVSAIMRVNVKLATAIVHEFSHAFVRANVEGPLETYSEPWIAGYRSNEMGCAVENHVFGGWFHALPIYDSSQSKSECHKQVITAPFGSHFVDPWDALSRNNIRTGELVLSNTPTGQVLSYPIPQRYFYKMHTEEMWGQRVPRYGLNALKLPKVYGWSASW
ncbi:hypothetical protein E4T44_01212 [Aureobasidium sp. EXF-8845]|nr:hypothetical protein E4T44_01212 [Aureobasidium sp. EXF-8845]KAI4853127.1 hypothetical protein E4T45_04453 [Aureobasidium sp. EXF-8846]